MEFRIDVRFCFKGFPLGEASHVSSECTVSRKDEGEAGNPMSDMVRCPPESQITPINARVSAVAQISSHVTSTPAAHSHLVSLSSHNRMVRPIVQQHSRTIHYNRMNILPVVLRYT